MNTKVSILKYPNEKDWEFCKRCALVTIGKKPASQPTEEWKHAILKARHSPIRTLEFAFLLENIPYWVSVHLARHVHAVPFVKSQRNDRQVQYDRNNAPQNAPVNMILYCNAEELMTIAEKRLCHLASKETREVMRMMCVLAVDKCSALDGLLAPKCKKYGVCDEMKPCGVLANGKN